ncbi:MAG: TIGR00725 family protein [Deltaproteobacteria bacterium]|nr:TIGR00725 family protein [Deltaproteobacteria bacterium]
MMAKPLVGVIGVTEAKEQERQMAFEVGKLIGAMGLSLVCGGLGGVMEEASRGCSQAGGTVIGLLPGDDKKDANDYVTYAIPTNLGHSRNTLIAHSADILVSIGTGYGTLSEVAIALKLGKKVLSYKSWDVQGVLPCQTLQEIQSVLVEFYGDRSTKSLLFEEKKP